MLVSRIIGDCPGCLRVDHFGNVSVGNQSVLRGCLKCKYSEIIDLPSLKKKVLYLDQFFYSRAFTMRSKRYDSKYGEAISIIMKLANEQLIITPFSSVHEDESYQWSGKDGKTDQELMNFIKKSSLGHEFNPAYEIKRNQILKNYDNFKAGSQPVLSTDPVIAFKDEIHQWSDYLWVDVKGYFGNADSMKVAKKAAVDKLLEVFDEWRKSEKTFEQHIDREYLGAALAYIKQYSEYIEMMSNGNFFAQINASLDSMVVEQMMSSFPKETHYDARMSAIVGFFKSDHYKLTPYEWISVRIFGLLREMVRKGAYKNKAKAERRIQGIFQDVQHIATYAPYCDAIFIDKGMAALLRDKRIGLQKHFGTVVFSEENWDQFIDWLSSLHTKMSTEHKVGLSLAYPVSK